MFVVGYVMIGVTNGESFDFFVMVLFIRSVPIIGIFQPLYYLSKIVLFWFFVHYQCYPFNFYKQCTLPLFFSKISGQNLQFSSLVFYPFPNLDFLENVNRVTSVVVVMSLILVQLYLANVVIRIQYVHVYACVLSTINVHYDQVQQILRNVFFLFLSNVFLMRLQRFQSQGLMREWQLSGISYQRSIIIDALQVKSIYCLMLIIRFFQHISNLQVQGCEKFGTHFLCFEFGKFGMCEFFGNNGILIVNLVREVVQLTILEQVQLVGCDRQVFVAYRYVIDCVCFVTVIITCNLR
eukprot:TRINITY_DN7488_c1_g1_i2.p1 TRINITY_DN7488_c1_g1~~TRINITY_DN7488_c1_g1_i2.p1  ORF type:complete len:294 (-),score=-4.76 TRINITY_DN7488_c1_g1_i2:73-954(-)